MWRFRTWSEETNMASITCTSEAKYNMRKRVREVWANANTVGGNLGIGWEKCEFSSQNFSWFFFFNMLVYWAGGCIRRGEFLLKDKLYTQGIVKHFGRTRFVLWKKYHDVGSAVLSPFRRNFCTVLEENWFSESCQEQNSNL